ncbi:MAG: carbohydrate-binding module family 14 protein [Pseudomonadota bacterium]
MKLLKTMLAAAVLMSAPGLAMAYECNWSAEQTAQISCAPGTSFDEASGTCVTVTG